MAQQPADGSPSSLTLRMLSAAVMLPVVFGGVWLGGWAFALLAAISAGLMYWEWQGLCGKNGGAATAFALACAAGPLVFLGFGFPASLGFGAAFGVVLNGFIARHYRLFLAGGFAYFYLACIGLVWLRELDRLGMETVIWLGVAVVMTDTCAYFTGRTLGGPKLAPKISPKKTWSGLIGGIAGAAAAGAAVAVIVGAEVLAVTVVSGAFAVVAQLGDLAVSKAKRTFNVKDSGNIIPGHGGVLDRFDGIVSSALVMSILVILGGESPLIWL